MNAYRVQVDAPVEDEYPYTHVQLYEGPLYPCDGDYRHEKLRIRVVRVYYQDSRTQEMHAKNQVEMLLTFGALGEPNWTKIEEARVDGTNDGAYKVALKALAEGVFEYPLPIGVKRC